MIIRVSDTYRITSNATCWQVEARKSDRKDGSERWEPVGYFSDFCNALVSLADCRIRTVADSATADEIKAALRQIRDECISAAEVFRELAV